MLMERDNRKGLLLYIALFFLQVSSIKFEMYVRCFLSATPQQLLMDHFTATLRME